MLKSTIHSAIVLLLLSGSAFAQFGSGTAKRVQTTSSTLPGSCNANPMDIYGSAGASPGFYYCYPNNVWNGPVSVSAGSSSGTAGFIPQWITNSTLGNSSPPIDNGITTPNVLTVTDSGGVAVPNGSLQLGAGSGGLGTAQTGFSMTEGTTAGMGAVNQDACAPSSTTHGWKCNNNNGGTFDSAMNVPALNLRTRACEIVIGGTGAANILQAGDDAIAGGSCYNGVGVTETITGVFCLADTGTTTTVTPIVHGGGTILTGALSCGNNVWSSTGTLSGTPTLTTTQSVDGAITAVGTAHSVHIAIVYTVPTS